MEILVPRDCFTITQCLWLSPSHVQLLQRANKKQLWGYQKSLDFAEHWKGWELLGLRFFCFCFCFSARCCSCGTTAPLVYGRVKKKKKKEKYLQINHFTLKITENKSRKVFLQGGGAEARAVGLEVVGEGSRKESLCSSAVSEGRWGGEERNHQAMKKEGCQTRDKTDSVF